MKYDDDHINVIIESLSEGDGRVRACTKANIHYSTFLEWYRNKPEFTESVKKAEINANDKIKDLAKRGIIEKFHVHWQSAAWWLERNFPEEFRQRQEHEITGNIKQELDVSSLSIETLQELAALSKHKSDD